MPVPGPHTALVIHGTTDVATWYRRTTGLESTYSLVSVGYGMSINACAVTNGPYPLLRVSDETEQQLLDRA